MTIPAETAAMAATKSQVIVVFDMSNYSFLDPRN